MLASQTTNAITITQPVLFCAHGSPMNIIEQSDYSDAMVQLSQKLKKPKAVIIVTPHWIENGFAISSNSEQFYDFYGFPKELYEVKYKPKTDKELAKQIANDLNIKYDESRRMDHGCWAVAMKLFPDGDVPVLQISISKNASFYQYLELGEKLTKYRDEDILIVASGNMTHNLRDIEYTHSNVSNWAQECENSICENVITKNIKNLCEPYDNITNFEHAHPYADHYMPILVAMGAIKENEQINIIKPQIQNGTISMACFTSEL